MITTKQIEEFINIVTYLGKESSINSKPSYEEVVKILYSILNSAGSELPQANPKTYSVLISQTGLNVPVIIQLKSDVSGITWLRVEAGVYIARKLGGFPENKTIPTNNPIALYNDDTKIKIVVKRINNNDIEVRTYDSLGKLSDGLLTNHYLEFNVYI